VLRASDLVPNSLSARHYSRGFSKLDSNAQGSPLKGTIRAIRYLPLQNPRILCVLGALWGEKIQSNQPRTTKNTKIEDWVGPEWATTRTEPAREVQGWRAEGATR